MRRLPALVQEPSRLPRLPDLRQRQRAGRGVTENPRRFAWVALLTAAIDQPQPSKDLKAAIEAVLATMDTPARISKRDRAVAGLGRDRRTNAQRALDSLLEIQRGR